MQFVPKSVHLRDEATDTETARAQARGRKRSPSELLFIVLHNGSVSVLTAIAWLLGSRHLALHAFTLEIGYEVFDTFHLGPAKLEPENLIHHIVAPICILCSMRTEVDLRVLCHLCICIDISGAVLGWSKFMLRFAHVSAISVYKRLFWFYVCFRIIGPYLDTIIIVWQQLQERDWRPLGVPPLQFTEDGHPVHHLQTDMTQLYFWAMAVMNAFNGYFCYVIHTRTKMNPHLLNQYEAAGHL